MKDGKKIKETILDMVALLWPITTKEVSEKLDGMDVKEDEVLSHFKELEKEKKIVVREHSEGVFAWPIEVDRFIKS